jgi:RNA polymerase sigma-70 factor (ECF subfamily)
MADVRVAWEYARAELPGVDVSEADFRGYLARHIGPAPLRRDDKPGPNPLTILTDAYLACACARGSAVAIVRFAGRYAAVIEGVRARFGERAPTRDELWSELSTRLFVAKEGGPAKITEYAGQGELGGWLRVVVLRILLNMIEARKPESPLEGRVLEGLLVTDASPELALARAERRSAITKALGQALSQMSARDRRLLRLAFAEGLTIDDLGQLYGVHRATAARWIRGACARLASSLRQLLRAELGLSASEYERWIESMGSSIDLSVAKYLASEGREGKMEG